MICELCNKNEATIVIKQISDDGTTIVHNICEACTQKFKVDLSGEDNRGVIKLFKAIEQKKLRQAEKIICPSCGTKLSDIVKYKHLGCIDCVFYFKIVIEQMMVSQNPNIKYKGLRPKKFNILNRPTESETLSNLNLQLQQAVEVENYELAAYLRDRIKELKK
ncbi:MAG: UvrB/UvrC motif-containing protein [Treponemataceae bacterium]